MPPPSTRVLTASSALLFTSFCVSAPNAHDSPQAGARTYAQNYKDMVLATCIATAYTSDPDAARDAGSSVSALRDWAYYDLEKAPGEIKSLVEDFLKRDYSNPLVDSEIQGVRFDFLKCLDLYHSAELDKRVEHLVINPQHTFRQGSSEPTRR